MLIRIATRKSELALWQARHVAGLLMKLDAVDEVELVPMTTRGDEVLDRSLQKIGGKGLFIKELENAMQDGRADIAVHSMKDVPAVMPEGFRIAAILERANPHDALVTRDGSGIDALAERARVGSSSLRRQAQLRMMRPDLVVEPLRGNVNTRLRKLDDGEYDAIVLAAAGLERLQLGERIAQAFTTDQMLPAAAQGAIGIECVGDREDLVPVLAVLTHPRTERTTHAERAIARALDASCQSPVATHARIEDGIMTVTALVALPDGSRYLRESIRGAADDGEALGLKLGQQLLEKGAGLLLELAESMHA